MWGWPWEADRNELQKQIDVLRAEINELRKEMEEMTTSQDSVDNAVTVLGTVAADLLTAATNIKAEIAASGTPVNTAALDTAVAALQQAQTTIDSLEKPPVTPPAPGA